MAEGGGEAENGDFGGFVGCHYGCFVVRGEKTVWYA